METAPLKSFAAWARTALIREVNARLAAVLAPGASERVEQANAVAALEKAVAAAGGDETGRAFVADKVAYTWFNRIIALRFMDANGYTGIGVVSPQAGVKVGQPEILADAKRGVFDTGVVSQSTRTAVAGLLDGTRASGDAQGEAYALLLADYCRHWNRAMPFMFEQEGDFTELLIPADLLADDSVLNRAVKVLTADVCKDVEVIGWLYQFYISERKDEVFAGFKKNKKAGAQEIPAATQLFTPHWIVRYLVENSVGRLWMLNHPSSALVARMDYYIAPVDEETDFLRIAKPEDLKVIDPACGSGHMLTYAFDLLYAIYEEEGYAPTDIPGLILTHNIYGTEIDPRAGALASFALTMKARGSQRTFFNRQVEPNICVLDPITFTTDELSELATADGDHRDEEAFWTQFAHADTFGSLIQPDTDLTARLADHLSTLDDDGSILRASVLDRAARVIDQATYLTRSYAVAVANPPYMGSKQMNALLSQFMKDKYPDSKSDLFAAFIERCTNLAGQRGAVAMITMQSWMFLSSYAKLRDSLLANQQIASMLHLGARAFDSIGGEVVSSTAFVLTNEHGKRAGSFVRLVDGNSEAEKITALRAALYARTSETDFYEASGDDFASIPGSPIVYWLSEKMRMVFTSGDRLGAVASLAVGLQTGDNNRFLRQWWEVSQACFAFACTSREEAQASGARWFPYNKGGEFRKWYGNQEHVVNWENDGTEIRAFSGDRQAPAVRRQWRTPTFHRPCHGRISRQAKPRSVLTPGLHP
ncbi:MAG: BREX-1 system adenine-specific DNA-methyltransferase PglX [Microthrixaceae bacterium]|nr:BREX-1 system adenine-specific DNA-methyltransferase PglX [Microthrixaceae bacterium]